MKKIIFFLSIVSLLIAFTAFKVKPAADTIVKIDLTGTGIPFEDACSTVAPLTFSSGFLQFNIAPDGITVRSTIISNLVVRDAAGTIYHGGFVQTFETIPVPQQTGAPEGFNFTTLFILNPQGAGTNINVHGVFHGSLVNGVPTLLVEQFTVACH